jgi:two-component system CheB/CheR fusion protein
MESKTKQHKQKMTKTSAGSGLYYVGIGASAGGLEALQPLVNELPTSANMTYILAQHMSPTHRSMLVELLSRKTKIAVEIAKENITPKANTLYVTPADTDITVKQGKLCLSQPSNVIGPKPSINRLFISLAEDQQEKSVGIILSGTGSDGAQGIQAIKAAGGVTFAQEPQSAKFDSMPIAAIRVGGADIVLPPAELARQLHSLVNHFDSKNIQHQVIAPTTVTEIIQQIAQQTGIDFSHYKEATLHRQIMRHMSAKQINEVKAYGDYLMKHHDELLSLAHDFLICVTEFFRDSEAFAALRITLQQLIKDKKTGDEIRIWVPACASGEEAYSVAILLLEMLAEQASNYKIKIFATDLNKRALETARIGFYPETALTNVDSHIVQKYFTVDNYGYSVNKRVRELVLFASHNLIKEPPFARLDVVCCRNLLIYFKPEVQERVIKVFHYALNDQGILFLGKSESVGKSVALFSEADRKNKIYLKRPASISTLHSLGYNQGIFTSYESTRVEPVETPVVKNVANGLDWLITHYAPPSVLISEEGEILEIFGDCSPFLTIKKGKADFNLFTLVHHSFRAEIRAFVYRVIKSHESAYSLPVRLKVAGVEKIFRVAVHYIGNENHQAENLLLVSFESVETASSQSLNTTIEHDINTEQQLLALEQELAVTRETLQSVIEELETANEELQALNEEAQASNEELQASTEELETANEELQATNEELATVNEDLIIRTTELSKLNQDMDNILSSLDEGIIVVNSNLMVRRFNSRVTSYFELAKGEMANLATLQLKHEIPDLLYKIQLVMDTGERQEFEFKSTHGNDIKYFHIKIVPYLTPDLDGDNEVVITIIDITEKKEVQNTLRLWASVFEGASEGAIITDEHNRIIAVNPAFTEITGYSFEEVKGKDPKLLSSGQHDKAFYEKMWQALDDKGYWKGEVTNKRKNGTQYVESLSIRALHDDDNTIIRYIAVFSDITDIKESLRTIEYQANYDHLTGLPNRNLIQDRIQQQLHHCRRANTLFAVLFLDLDHFKAINDSLGHEVGDKFLIAVAKRLQAGIRDEDTVGRLGGDEFVILLNSFKKPDDIIQIATKIINEIRQPFVVEGHAIHTSCSIGITIYPTDGNNVNHLMKNADTAMYEAKKKGRNCFSFFTQEMQDKANLRHWVSTELTSAISNNQLALYFQPIVDLNTMQVTRAEALVRWNHPQKGMIPPNQFIDVAEQSNLIIELSEWITTSCIKQSQVLQQQLGEHFITALNVSMAQFVADTHMQWLIEQLQQATAPLTIELTESLKFIDNAEYKHYLTQIKATGAHLALDDFGTGQSSLSYLKQIDADIVKIDQTFVRDIITDQSDADMIAAIIAMAKAFKMVTVAEGIESSEQLAFLQQHGCQYGQGFLFSQALPLDEFIRFTRAFNAGEMARTEHS